MSVSELQPVRVATKAPHPQSHTSAPPFAALGLPLPHARSSQRCGGTQRRNGMPKADAAIAAPQSVKRVTTAGSRIACGFVNSGMAAEPPCKRPRALPVAYLSRIEVRQALDKHLTRTLLNPPEPPTSSIPLPPRAPIRTIAFASETTAPPLPDATLPALSFLM